MTLNPEIFHRLVELHDAARIEEWLEGLDPEAAKRLKDDYFKTYGHVIDNWNKGEIDERFFKEEK